MVKGPDAEKPEEQRCIPFLTGSDVDLGCYKGRVLHLDYDGLKTLLLSIARLPQKRSLIIWGYPGTVSYTHLTLPTN